MYTVVVRSGGGHRGVCECVWCFGVTHTQLLRLLCRSDDGLESLLLAGRD